LVSLNSTDHFSVPAPTITPGTIRSPGGVPSTAFTSSTPFGEEIVFNGTNFGNWLQYPTYWSVTYGPTGREAVCVVNTTTSNDNEVYCTAGLSSVFSVVTGLVFRVTIFGRSVTGTDVYNYPDVPVITSITGCTDTNPSAPGIYPLNGTYGCSTLGG
jgi:hypothetical protein